jgi:hypothetical protein
MTTPVSARGRFAFPAFIAFGIRIICYVVAVLYGTVSVHATDFIWTDGTTGNWNVNGNWSAVNFPNSSADNAFIDGGNTGQNSSVTLNISASIGTMQIDSGDRVTVASGNQLDVFGLSLLTSGNARDHFHRWRNEHHSRQRQRTGAQWNWRAPA